MIKEDAFKTWLEQGGAASIAGQKFRVSAIRTIERKLDELVMPFRNLDEAWEADRFESLSKRLGRMRKNARDGGHDYRILMPDSENPHNGFQAGVAGSGNMAGSSPASHRDRPRMPIAFGNMSSNTISSPPERKSADRPMSSCAT